jgi:hypothetical protein
VCVCNSSLLPDRESTLYSPSPPLGCSRTYQQAYGYLKSPGWPDVYPLNTDCTVVLMAPQGSSISLFFNSFDIEGHSLCAYDYLEVSWPQWRLYAHKRRHGNNMMIHGL